MNGSLGLNGVQQFRSDRLYPELGTDEDCTTFQIWSVHFLFQLTSKYAQSFKFHTSEEVTFQVSKRNRDSNCKGIPIGKYGVLICLHIERTENSGLHQSSNDGHHVPSIS